MIMDTLLGWLLKVWMTLTGSKPKELPQSITVETKTDDEISIALIGELVKIKRELKGEAKPDERTAKIVEYIVTKTIPAFFRKNFLNGENRMLIGHTDIALPKEHHFISTPDFEKAIPYVIKKVTELGIKSEISSGFLVIFREGLLSIADKNDIEPVENETDFTVNSTGIYR